MKNYTILLLLVVAACFSCGGNNPVPTIGMTQSSSNADAIISTKNNFTFTRNVNTHLGRDKHSENLEKSINNVIPQEDDFLTEEISSPAKELDVPKEHYQLDAESGGSFTYEKTGSTVMIPPDALVDKNGNPVKGEVDISYREFHTQKEIFFSGIPMDFDVNGEKQFFESAGMIDISASQNGEEVFVRKGSEISFNMSTDNRNEEVKLYELNKKTKKWEELGNAPAVTKQITPKKRWGPVYSSEKSEGRKRAPFRVYIENYLRKYDAETKTRHYKIQFSIQLIKNTRMKNKKNRKEFLNVNKWNEALFEVQGIKKRDFTRMLNLVRKKNVKDKDSYYYSIPADIKISQVNDPYLTLEMSYEGNKISLDVEVLHRRYRSAKSKKKFFDIVSQFPINDFDGRHSTYPTWTNCIERYDSISPGLGDAWSNSYIVQREFTAKNFGILNCDQPKLLPKEMIANASFYIDDEKLNPDFVILADFKQNVLFTYYNNKLGHFGFNPKADNFIFTTLKDGTVAFIMPEEFKEVQKGGALKVKMHRVSMENFGQVMEDLFPTKSSYSYTL